MNPLFEININSLPGPHDIHRQVLKNGITILPVRISKALLWSFLAF